jgi:glutaredoxin
VGRGRLIEVTLYSRPGCHLCDEAREAILAVRAEGPAFDLRDVNIDEDERLHAEYLERIPVVEVKGEIVSELDVDLHALRSRLHTVAA